MSSVWLPFKPKQALVSLLGPIIPTCLSKGGMTRPPSPFQCNCEPERPAAGAKRPHAAEGREGERSETVVPEATD